MLQKQFQNQFQFSFKTQKIKKQFNLKVFQTLELKELIKGITITKTIGQHGNEEILSIPNFIEYFGTSMGFVLRAPGQKTVYFAGDTIWHEYVKLEINRYKPDIIVLNATKARYEGIKGSSVMVLKMLKNVMNLLKLRK